MTTGDYSPLDPDPPSIPIRAGGVVRVRDILDLLEAADLGEDDVVYVQPGRIEAGR